MSIVVTNECNMLCEFCINEYRGIKGFVSIKSVQNALSWATSNGIKDVALVGGEPTLHPEIGQIVAAVRSAGMRCIVTTNYTQKDVFDDLDGMVDCWNISFYGQKDLPQQKDYKSDITLSAIIRRGQLDSWKSIDDFIFKYERHSHLKFSTLTPCNQWCIDNAGDLDFLGHSDCEFVILFNELVGQIYRGHIIKRYDMIINPGAHQSMKVNVDGTMQRSWSWSDADRWQNLHGKS